MLQWLLSVIGVMQGLVDKYYSCSFIFGRDLNTSKLSTTSTRDLLSNFCNKNSLLWLDPTLNGIDYTYHNDNLGNFSLIDCFVCSPKLVGSSIHNQILNHGDNISDHLAIMCNFKPN